ncbi:MAG: hypothetical protein U0165_14555 [Polyangiaceae bacterium]
MTNPMKGGFLSDVIESASPTGASGAAGQGRSGSGNGGRLQISGAAGK